MIQGILINSIIIKDKDYIEIPNFTPIEKAMAWKYSEDVYQSNFESGVYTEEEISFLLDELEIWTESDEVNLTKHNDELDQLKVDYFDNFFFASRLERIKKAIKLKDEVINELLGRKSSMSEYTCEASRGEAYYLELFKKFENPLGTYRKYFGALLREKQIRELYFDGTWRLIWSASKDATSIFGTTLSCLNQNQLSLLYWSKLYDNIGEAQESPPTEALKDTLAVDGWLIKHSRKRENENKSKAFDKDAGEVFVPVRNKKEQAEILNLNTNEGTSIIKARTRDLKDRGDLNEFEFSHVKADIGMQLNAIRNKK